MTSNKILVPQGYRLLVEKELIRPDDLYLEVRRDVCKEVRTLSFFRGYNDVYGEGIYTRGAKLAPDDSWAIVRKKEKDMITDKSKYDLVFETKTQAQRDAVAALAAAYGQPKLRDNLVNSFSQPRLAIRLSVKDGRFVDHGSSDRGTITYTEPGSYWNPLVISPGPVSVKLPNIGDYEVVAKPDELQVGCQHIKWETVESLLKARPKS